MLAVTGMTEFPSWWTLHMGYSIFMGSILSTGT